MNVFKISDLIRAASSHCWLIDLEWLQRIREQLKSSEAIQPTQARKDSVLFMPSDPRNENSSGVAILNIEGVLLYSGPEWLEDFGYTTYSLLGRRLDALNADARVKTILLRIQSPGGTALGASEISEKIYRMRGSKKIVAYADPYAFSAAYEIGSAASEFYTTRSGMVGSIGSYSMHTDYSAYLDELGIKVTFIKAGEKKTDGNAYEPLSERAKKDIQDQVNHFYEVFVSDVARNRNVDSAFVKENFGKGGIVMSAEALQAGMIDGISSMQDLIKKEMSFLVNENGLIRSRAINKRKLALLSLEDESYGA